jgi:hypothetical protein
MDQNTSHYWITDIMGINSGICDKCGYNGKNISAQCECGIFHNWCNGCWKHSEMNAQAEDLYG